VPTKRRTMFDRDLRTVPNSAATSLVLPVLALAAAGIGVILLAGSLGAATSGRTFWSQWFGPSAALTHEKSRMRGQTSGDLTRTSDLPEVLDRSGV
jgi:hypothetical protein